MLKEIVIIMLTSLLVSGLVVAGCSSTPAQGARVGNPAPDLQLPNLDGETVSLSDLRGSPILLNFWASRCDDCRYEMPFIQEIYEGWTGKPPSVVVLAINIGESSAKVKEFVESYGLSFPVLLDIKEKVADRYNIRPIPTTFFIDKDGIIQAKKIGAFQNKEAIEKYLREIIP